MGKISRKDPIELPMFITLVPMCDYTGLFFSGGMNANLVTRQASLLGIEGKGVIAGGVKAEFDPVESLNVETTSAVLFSQEPSQSGTFYGFEQDLLIDVALWGSLSLSVEADMLFPGTFFSDQDPVVRAMVGVDATF